jgi:hypothetical protein
VKAASEGRLSGFSTLEIQLSLDFIAQVLVGRNKN